MMGFRNSNFYLCPQHGSWDTRLSRIATKVTCEHITCERVEISVHKLVHCNPHDHSINYRTFSWRSDKNWWSYKQSKNASQIGVSKHKQARISGMEKDFHAASHALIVSYLHNQFPHISATAHDAPNSVPENTSLSSLLAKIVSISISHDPMRWQQWELDHCKDKSTQINYRTQTLRPDTSLLWYSMVKKRLKDAF